VGCQRHPGLLYPQERELTLLLLQARWAPGPFWMGKENFCPTGIRSIQPVASCSTDHAIPGQMCHKNIWYKVSFIPNLASSIKEGNVDRRLLRNPDENILPQRQDAISDWGKFHNEEFHMYLLPYIITTINLRRGSFAQHVGRTSRKRNSYKFFRKTRNKCV